MLDLAYVRSRFPGLRDEWTLLDNAGGSLPAAPVIERTTRYLTERAVQLGGTYPRSAACDEAVDAGRAAVAALMNAGPDEVVINGSTTLNAHLLSRALAPALAPGDEVVVTNLDHEANSGAWRRLEADGAVIREWQLDPADGSLPIARLEALLGPRTRLVCFTHCSNVVGSIHDVEKITRLVHDAGARVCVDGVAYAPHRALDMKAWDVDFYLFSLYKTYGPHLGALYVKREHLEALASQNHFFIPNDSPGKLEPGGVCHELTASLVGIVDYLSDVASHHGDGPASPREAVVSAYARFREHEARIVAPFLEWLERHPEVRIIGEPSSDPDRRVPTVAFTVAGRHANDVVTALEADGVAVRWGDFYARRAIEAFGLGDSGGIIRASLVHYNSMHEVERLIAGLERVLG